MTLRPIACPDCRGRGGFSSLVHPGKETRVKCQTCLGERAVLVDVDRLIRIDPFELVERKQA